MANEQLSGTVAERLERPFLQLSIQSGLEITKFENVISLNSGDQL